MRTFLEPFPQAADNTLAIAHRCNVEFDFKTYHFPKFETPPGQSQEELFEEKSRQGFKKRWLNICQRPDHGAKETYKKRLDHEITTIKKMGFAGYFLIVADFIEYAKNNNIPVKVACIDLF